LRDFREKKNTKACHEFRFQTNKEKIVFVTINRANPYMRHVETTLGKRRLDAESHCTCEGILERVVDWDGVLTDEEYLTDQDGSLFDNPCHNITSISDGAFFNCEEVVNISLSAATSIGDEAFYVSTLMYINGANYNLNICCEHTNMCLC